jgi:hypothetical protein
LIISSYEWYSNWWFSWGRGHREEG